MIARISAIGPFGVLLLGVAGIVFAATLVLGWQINDEDNPAANRVFDGESLRDDTPVADVAGTVNDVAGDLVSVRVGEELVPVRVSADAVIQQLVPITPADVQPGDWLIVGGTDDNVHTLILQAAVVAGPYQVILPAGATR